MQGCSPRQFVPRHQIHALLTDFVGMGVPQIQPRATPIPLLQASDSIQPEPLADSPAIRIPSGQTRFGTKPPFRAGLRSSASLEHHCRPVGDMCGCNSHHHPHTGFKPQAAGQLVNF